jgi:DNA-binding CsgD family transcriptional regulator
MASDPCKPGRPAHEPTDESRTLVATLVGRGKSPAEIAVALGISTPTLRSHYRQELHAARPQKNIPLPEFDAPPPPRAGRARAGRPEHVPTDESRDEVEILLAAGTPAWAVAQALGISESTLREHYGAQLDHGRARKRAAMTVALFRSGMSGNVAAQKAFLALDTPLDPPPPPEDKPEALGKKAAADQAARSAGAGVDWARHLPH